MQLTDSVTNVFRRALNLTDDEPVPQWLVDEYTQYKHMCDRCSIGEAPAHVLVMVAWQAQKKQQGMYKPHDIPFTPPASTPMWDVVDTGTPVTVAMDTHDAEGEFLCVSGDKLRVKVNGDSKAYRLFEPNQVQLQQG